MNDSKWTMMILSFVVATTCAVWCSGQEIGGEDLGQRGEDPQQLAIRRATRQMLAAQRLLAQRQTARETQSLQAAVSDELQRLIADLETSSTAKASGGGSPSDPPQEQTGNSGAANGETPPSGTEPDIGKPQASTKTGDAKIWGHLPQRLRQRMRTAGVEEFLPQYEQMLEEYYRRLSGER